MPNQSILDSTSYSTLDISAKKAVCGLFEDSYRAGKEISFDTYAIFKQRQSLAVSVERCALRLDKTNPAGFKYLNDLQREWLRQELLFAFYIFSAQYHLDKVEHRGQALKDRGDQILHCASLIQDLDNSASTTPETLLQTKVDDSLKPVKYLGLTVLTPMVADTMLNVVAGDSSSVKEWATPGKTVKAIEEMSKVNGLRLYWVWGGCLLSTVISMLPDTFINKQSAGSAVAMPAPITGYASWLLYYTRFGVNLSLLLKHTLTGPWMSVEERDKIPAWERFKSQWNQRKFALLNDSIWGVANMACYFWLVGPGMLGYCGNVATAGLLVMDV